MHKKDIHEGRVVYHSIFTTWGKGVVQKVTTSIFDARKRYYHIKFDGRAELVRIDDSRSLRKTPNRSKIRAMVELYKGRGVEAVDGGDRLIIPGQEEGNASG